MNRTPYYPTMIKNPCCSLLNGNTSRDGYHETMDSYLLYTASTNGTLFNQVYINSCGTNPTTVIRFFLNNGLDYTNVSNNSLFAEVELPAKTVSSSVGNSRKIKIINMALPANYRVYVTTSSSLLVPIHVVGNVLEY